MNGSNIWSIGTRDNFQLLSKNLSDFFQNQSHIYLSSYYCESRLRPLIQLCLKALIIANSKQTNNHISRIFSFSIIFSFEEHKTTKMWALFSYDKETVGVVSTRFNPKSKFCFQICTKRQDIKLLNWVHYLFLLLFRNEWNYALDFEFKTFHSLFLQFSQLYKHFW
jgi:hypothetical protein